MSTKMQLQTTGYLTKEEELQSFDVNVIPGTLVLETKAPYPGYFGENLPDIDKKRECFYIVLGEPLPSRRIFRLEKQLNEYSNEEFEASPCDLTIYTNHFRALRIRNITDYATIDYIQHGLIDQGYKLMKYKKIDAPARIRLEKYFNLEFWGNIGYKDLDDKFMNYIILPKHLSWSQFKSISQKLKNNIKSINYDIAYSELLIGSIIDTVRIYSHHVSFEELQEIKEKFKQYIK